MKSQQSSLCWDFIPAYRAEAARQPEIKAVLRSKTFL